MGQINNRLQAQHILEGGGQLRQTQATRMEGTTNLRE
jgi:hypothetical protein